MSARRRSSRLVAVSALALAAVLVAAPAGSAQSGQEQFQQSCTACHTLGGGDAAGPDLAGVVGRIGEERVREWVGNPEQVIASGDPEVDALVERFGGVHMPNLGLSDAQIDAVVGYLAAQEGGPAGGEGEGEGAPPPAAAPEGDVHGGRHLFTGERHFENGGPSCMSCHQISGADIPVGGQVGPDLTDAYDKYGGATGLIPVLASMPFPSMQPVYRGHELTRQEQADLAAFLATTVGAEPREDETWILVLIGLGVTVLLLGLMFLVWPRRRLVVRRRIAPTPSPRRH